MNKIILFIIIIIILYIVYRNIELVEGYNKWGWRLFNQNWNKPWSLPQVAFNNPYPQDIPRSSNNDENFPDYILEIVKEGYVDKVLNKMTVKNVNTHSFQEVKNWSWDNKFKVNKNTWYNSLNDFNLYNDNNYEDNQMEFKLHKSCIPQVNKVLRYFISKFNEIFPRTCNEKSVRDHYGYSPFSIYKFKIHDIKQKKDKNGKCVINYAFIVVLIRDESYVGITLYLNYIVSDKSMNLVYYDLIGYYNTDKLFLPSGKRTVGKHKYYELNPLYRISKRRRTLNEYVNKKNWPYLNINYYNVDKILWKTKNYNYDNTLKNQYTCFNTEPQYYNPNGIPPTTPGSDSQPILTYVYNKSNCESKYDNFGRRKPKGLWDRPCLSDSECIFYGKNKNYPNDFGRCNKEYGFCELPRGMKNLGFHYYYPYNLRKNPQKDQSNPICDPNQGNPAPLCYNCKSVNKTNKWQPITKLDTCCNTQHNKVLYPHLNGPDYAFTNDINERINSYHKQNFFSETT